MGLILEIMFELELELKFGVCVGFDVEVFIEAGILDEYGTAVGIEVGVEALVVVWLELKLKGEFELGL